MILILKKCLICLFCEVHGPIYGRFIGCNVTRGFVYISMTSVIYKRPTDLHEGKRRTLAPTAPIAPKLRLYNTR